MNSLPVKQILPQAAIFDLDGILVDTEYFQWQGWIEVLKPFGKSLSKEQYFKYAGKHGNIIETELTNDLNMSPGNKSLTFEKEKILMTWFDTKPISLCACAVEAINFFLNKNIKVACASSGPGDEIRLKLKKTGLLPYFQTIVSGNDVARGKPFPDIYAFTANALKLNPSDCLAFEDTQYGVEAAKSAGLRCFAIPNEFTRKQNFSQADAVFANLKEAISSFN